MKRHLVFSVFAVLSLLLFPGCGKKSGTSRDGFDIPPSLVQRMTLAHNAARDKMFASGGEESRTMDAEEFWGLRMAGFANADEIAARPRGEMVFADDGLDDEARRELWPFDIESFEAGLEAKMVLDEHGLFCLKDEDGNPATPSNPTFRWVNARIAEWAVAQLDARFGRLDDETFRELLGGGEPPDDLMAWPLDRESGEYFLISRNEGAWEARTYVFLRWDGTDSPVSFGEFESFPNSREAAVSRRLWKDPSSLNNMAVLIWQHRLDRMGMDPRELVEILEEAAREGVACAKDNLAVLRAHIPEVDE